MCAASIRSCLEGVQEPQRMALSLHRGYEEGEVVGQNESGGRGQNRPKALLSRRLDSGKGAMNGHLEGCGGGGGPVPWEAQCRGDTWAEI